MHHINRRPVKSNKWYIVDTERISKLNKVPRLFKKEFDNSYQAKRCIERYLGNNIRFDYIKGSEAINLGMTVMNRFPAVYKKHCTNASKYDYTEEDISWRDKKTYRTRFRRHNRGKYGDYYKRKA